MEMMESFRSLIRLQELKDRLLEHSPNAFERIQIVSYPEAWLEPPPEPEAEAKQPQSLDDIEPFDCDFTEFDMRMQGLYHLIATENTEPLPEKEQDPEGYRDLFGPPEDLDKVDLPIVYCRRKQPTRLPKNFKQRLPFPVYPLEEEPTLHIKPWMLEPLPPTIDWNKQQYQAMFDEDNKPAYVRWEEYPEYDDEEFLTEIPSLKDEFIPYAKNTKKTKGLCRIYHEEEDPTPEDMYAKMEQRKREEHFQQIMLGRLPDHWWEKEDTSRVKDLGDREIVGVRPGLDFGQMEHNRSEDLGYSKDNPFMAVNAKKPEGGFEGEESWRGGRGGRGRGGGRWRPRWRQDEDDDDGEGEGEGEYDGYRAPGGWGGRGGRGGRGGGFASRGGRGGYFGSRGGGDNVGGGDRVLRGGRIGRMNQDWASRRGGAGWRQTKLAGTAPSEQPTATAPQEQPQGEEKKEE